MAYTTRPSLLVRVHNGDEISWNDFYETYAGLLRLCGKDWLLLDDEIDDLVQQVMGEIFRKDIVGLYLKKHQSVPSDVTFRHDKANGRFRDYLKKITRNKAIGLYKARKKHEADPIEDENQVEDKITSDEWDCAWDKEWKKHVLAMAMQELRNTVETDTFLAFEMFAVQQRPIEVVTDSLEISRNSVYVAKNRCIKTLNDIIKRLNE